MRSCKAEIQTGQKGSGASDDRGQQWRDRQAEIRAQILALEAKLLSESESKVDRVAPAAISTGTEVR